MKKNYILVALCCLCVAVMYGIYTAYKAHVPPTPPAIVYVPVPTPDTMDNTLAAVNNTTAFANKTADNLKIFTQTTQNIVDNMLMLNAMRH